MTVEEYYACIKQLGLTPHKKGYNGFQVYVDRDGGFHSMPDPTELSPEERQSVMALKRSMMGWGTEH